MVEVISILRAARPALSLRGVIIPEDPYVITPTIRQAILTGRFESEEADAVPGIVRPGDVVLEIGGGLGFISTLLAREPAVRRVISVEANPDLIDYMAGLHAVNGVSVTRINAVLTNEPVASADFFLRRDFWMSSLMPEPNPYVAKVKVPARNLDILLWAEAVTLVVCDIEGAEAFLFDGADLSGVDRIFLELHDHVTGLKGVQCVFRALAEQGFTYDPRHSTGSVVLFQRVHANEVPRPYPG
jgi:FkbM family methyltransferase